MTSPSTEPRFLLHPSNRVSTWFSLQIECHMQLFISIPEVQGLSSTADPAPGSPYLDEMQMGFHSQTLPLPLFPSALPFKGLFSHANQKLAAEVQTAHQSHLALQFPAHSKIIKRLCQDGSCLWTWGSQPLTYISALLVSDFGAWSLGSLLLTMRPCPITALFIVTPAYSQLLKGWYVNGGSLCYI